MLLQIKVYLIATSYFLGALFMLLFPPRNYELSGAKIRTVRSVGEGIKYKQYADYKMVANVAERYGRHDPEVVNVVQLAPLTAGNRSILAIELRSDRQSRKPGILIIGALDAMSWGAPNAILELSEKLLYDASYQTPFFNDYDWYLIPMGNPDGIQFSHNLRSLPPLDPYEWARNATARLWTRPSEWHKNVDNESESKDPLCFGTNINRNFAYHWQDDVHKTPPRCCQYYPGSKPFSSAEAKAIRKYVDKLGDVISLAIHLHASFVPRKEYILYPWRYSVRQTSNSRTLQEIGEYAARQARLPDGRVYEVHQSSSDERVAGTLSDYISGVVGIDLVFLIKPYHQMFPNETDNSELVVYVKKAVSTILSVVRGWRSSTKQNTLSFFGKDVEF
ncbi:zinc carboxypeptidase-like isoform X1 [Trichoplusia ni]|uniref:Zinc carboxypeptidase-like isoform X1 n=1 Tax=Trichoplusia ni TaxID=7111 RepID=A0A7E5V9P0_TRINI|nr:zinc carboxypeptidase-like isoform X1 [Trichoplusia ni]